MYGLGSPFFSIGGPELQIRQLYEDRAGTRREAAAAHEVQFRRLGNLRLACVIIGGVVAWWNFYWLPVPVLAFVLLVIYHDRLARKQANEERAAAFYERGLARLDHRWMGSGPSGDRFRNLAHPYAEDLDLFGNGSLFQLLSLARTSAGEHALAGWLMTPAPARTVRERQRAVQELTPNLDLREDLALLGEETAAEVHPEALVRWGGLAREPIPAWSSVLVWICTAATVTACVGYFGQLWTARPLLICILIQGTLALYLRDTVRRILERVELPAHDLKTLALVLGRIERQPVESPLLVNLKQSLAAAGLTPSRQIHKLHSLVERYDWSRNQMFAPVAALLLWKTHSAIAIERWRQRSGSKIGSWLEAVGEMEALASLAGYAAEHPGDVFPVLEEGPPRFEAAGLAHPLLHEPSSVRNDVSLGSTQLLVVSGSNMSGKSTLLRAVGLNTVLAWAGAPVRAASLKLTPLQVGASIRVQDSLQDGKSRFYAEITRLRQIVDLATGGRPLLFLLDELLSGTNSHDRRIGAEALVKTLVSRGALGLLTTHDLALADIAGQIAGRARNVHFEDHIEQGRIAFDYKMRPGVVTKSNALELMRSVGLEV